MPDIVRPEYRYENERRGFMAGAQAIAIAGQFAAVHLFNPSGSGVHLVCFRMRAGSPAGASEIRPHVTAVPLGATTGIVIVNKYREGTPIASAAEVRFDTDTTSPIASTTPFARDTPLQATPVEFLSRDSPFVIEEEQGIGCQLSVAALTLECFFEWWEFPA